MIQFIMGMTVVAGLLVGWQWVDMIKETYAIGWIANIGVLLLCVAFYFLGKVRILGDK